MSKRRIGALGAKGVLRVFPVQLLAFIVVSNLTLAGLAAQGNLNSSNRKESERAGQVRALNKSVLQLHGQLQESSSNASALRSQAASVLTQRAAALHALIQENPGAALSFAFSPDLLADLADQFPGSSDLLEAHGSWVGSVEHWIADDVIHKKSASTLRLHSGARILNLYFAAGQEPDLRAGALYQVEGVALGSEVAVSSAKLAQRFAMWPGFIRPALQPDWLGLAGLAGLIGCLFVFRRREPLRRLASCACVFVLAALSPIPGFGQSLTCSTTGVQNVAVLLVTFPNATLPTTLTTQSLQDVFFNTNTGISLDGFLREASYGQTSATGGAFGPFTLSGAYSSCTDVGGAVLNDAIAAAVASGVNLHNYTRLVLIFPDVFTCGWQGFANVGSCSQTTSSGTFNLSVAYITADYATPRSSGVQLAAHEIGHNLGLLHAGTITSTTPADVLGPLGSAGAESDLGDNWSTMGQVELGLYPSPSKAEVLGWMSSALNYQVVETSGTYTLQPLEMNPPGLQALKVRRGSSNEWLWIEYRQPIGNYDSTLLSQPYSGALIHYQDPNAPVGHTYVPNFTPSDSTGFSAALAVGRSWTDPYSNVSITVQSANSNGLTVNIGYGVSLCGQSTPSVVVSPLNPSIFAGQTASYTATVTNNDPSGCASSSINLSSNEPSGWSTNFSSSSITLSAGQSAKVSLGKGSPAGTPVGTYAVNLTASSNSSSGEGIANATVVTPPSVTVTISIAGSSFSRPSTVPITALVTNGGVPAPGASVKFTLTTPAGGSATQSATTGTNGSVTWNYKLNSRSQPGTYSVTSQASVNSGSKKAAAQATSSNVVSFIVQ